MSEGFGFALAFASPLAPPPLEAGFAAAPGPNCFPLESPFGFGVALVFALAFAFGLALAATAVAAASSLHISIVAIPLKQYF